MMNFKQLLTDNDAVSPVIGVILMVAITVILAAVIGTFVLGLGDQVSNTSPTASFTFDYTEDGNSTGTNDQLTITHDGGDSIAAGQLNASVSGGTGDDKNGGNTGADIVWASDLFGSGSDVTAGTSTTVSSAEFSAVPALGNGNKADVDANLDLSGATFRVIWQSSNGGDTATLGKWSGPDA